MTTIEEQEVRSVDVTTGAEKGTKLARFDLIPPGPLLLLAEHYGRGARKYADRNWEKGYSWGKSFAAMMRHAWAFWRGETIDKETGSSHLVAVAWHAFALLEYANTHPEKDDRPNIISGFNKQVREPDMVHDMEIDPTTGQFGSKKHN